MSEPAPVSELETRFILLPYPGLSYSQVAKQLHVSKPALIGWGHIHCFAIRLRKEIDALTQPPGFPKTPPLSHPPKLSAKSASGRRKSRNR